jgi:hypothetical protein
MVFNEESLKALFQFIEKVNEDQHPDPAPIFVDLNTLLSPEQV